MKPAAFDYARPTRLAEAAALLLEGGEDARVLAGGQSLGPMLNFRLVRPRLLIDIMHVSELHGIHEADEAILIGATVTHAAVEDGAVPDLGKSVLATVAAGIAYRAVRNRGTVAGSLCHADPLADWVTALAALDASVVTYRAGGGRAIPVASFIRGAFHNLLEKGEGVGRRSSHPETFASGALGMVQGMPQARRVCERYRRGSHRSRTRRSPRRHGCDWRPSAGPLR